jgi:DNA polymerase III subunit delta
MSRAPAYLLTGPEELLLRRAADRLLEELGAGGELDVTDVRAGELKERGLPDLRTGSLFGTPRAVVIREGQDLPAEVVEVLLAELAGPPPDATVIVLATGTARIMRLARRIKELDGRMDITPPREWEDRRWAQLVAEELRRHGRTGDAGAVQALLAHAGYDVSAIAEKTAQAAAAAPAGTTLTAELVEEVVVGHGSRGSFAVADAMCDRDPGRAVTLLRGVFEAGDDPVMVLGALVYRIRSIVAVAAGLDPRSVGLNLTGGQAGKLKGVRRNFGPGELTRAYRALADADKEIKGGELPAAFAVERAVLAIATPA